MNQTVYDQLAESCDDPKQLLRDTRALRRLFRDKTRWTQGCYAQDRDGWATDPDASGARRWCLLGGIKRVTWLSDNRERPLVALAASLVHPAPFFNVQANVRAAAIAWNDRPRRQFRSVQTLLRRMEETAKRLVADAKRRR